MTARSVGKHIAQQSQIPQRVGNVTWHMCWSCCFIHDAGSWHCFGLGRVFLWKEKSEKEIQLVFLQLTALLEDKVANE